MAGADLERQQIRNILSSPTCSSSHHASFASDCYAAVPSHCENEPVSFNDTGNSENSMTAIQSEYGVTIKNGTWSTN